MTTTASGSNSDLGGNYNTRYEVSKRRGVGKRNTVGMVGVMRLGLNRKSRTREDTTKLYARTFVRRYH